MLKDTPETIAPPGRLRHVLAVAPGSLRVRTEDASRKHAPAMENAEGRGRRLFRAAGTSSRSELEAESCAEGTYVPDDHGTVESAVTTKTRRITGFSPRSRARMMYRLSTLPWADQAGIAEMVTLTYPREFPTDGPTVKRHLHAFAKRWQRRFGAWPVGVWKLEFQRRGAPHFHLYVMRPLMPWREFLDWAREAWYEVVGSGDEAHRHQGVRLDRQFVAATRSVKRIAGYFAKHNAKNAKHYQSHPPEGFEQVGRFWGVWGMTPQVTELELHVDEFVQLRRFLVALQRKNGRKRKAPGRLIGCWTLAHQAPVVALDLMRWCDETLWGLSPPRRRNAAVQPVG